MDFDNLVQTLLQLEDGFRLETGRAVNQYMTVRNWLMGFYIVEFEQNGADRAQYGTKVLENLAKSINRKGLSFRNLKLYRQFYQTYKQLALHAFEIVEHLSIGQTSAQFQTATNQIITIGQASAQSFTTAPELHVGIPAFWSGRRIDSHTERGKQRDMNLGASRFVLTGIICIFAIITLRRKT